MSRARSPPLRATASATTCGIERQPEQIEHPGVWSQKIIVTSWSRAHDREREVLRDYRKCAEAPNREEIIVSVRDEGESEPERHVDP